MKHPEAPSFTEALQSALTHCGSITQSEVVMSDALLGRIFAEEVIVTKNLPSFNNSAMDGFAFRHDERGRRLKIRSTVFAGEKPHAALNANECYKIMTGAQVPADADTIVPIENCTDVTESKVTIPADIKKGNAFRHKGEEQKTGTVLFEKGERITPAHIALLSAQGIVSAKVYRPLRIAVLSTGDEIKEPWESATEDEIYNANASALTALMAQYGFNAVYAGAIPDDPDKTVTFIQSLKSCYDVIVTTGGISMGEHDFTGKAFMQNGLKVLFHGVKVKPGHPTMMGTMEKTFVMAMPGNPLAAMVNFMLLSLPVLFKLQGSTHIHHDFIYAQNAQTFGMRPGRTNIVLGNVTNGIFHVTRNNKYGSGMLTPIVESNAVALFGEDVGSVKEGEMIRVILFDSAPQAKDVRWMNV
jgi:molybdopterin molybdotransferase